MSREEAVALVKEKQYEFPVEYFDDFLNYHQITKREYFKLEDKWRNYNIWEKKGGEWRLKIDIS